MNRKTTYKDKYIHIILKNTMDQPLFLSKSDYGTFYKFLVYKLEQYNFKLIAYGLYPSHVQFVCTNLGNHNFSDVIHALKILYVKYYNKKYQLKGSVFKEGYTKEMIGNNTDLLCLIRYIHQKPMTLGLSSSLSYPYTSFNDYKDSKATSELFRYPIYSLFHKDNPTIAANLFTCIHHEKEKSYYMTLDHKVTRNVEKATKILKEQLERYKVSYDDIPKNYHFRDQLIMRIYDQVNLTQQQIADLLHISRHIVGRSIRMHVSK